MNLFPYNSSENILPFDGEVYYFGNIFNEDRSQYFFNRLLNKIHWKNDELIIFSKHITTRRKVAWYADSDFAYTYSNTTKHALSWNSELLELKNIVEKQTHKTFNSCLLNLYHNGTESMSWHCDDEASLGINTSIASLSFGAQRRFSFKHKENKEKRSLILENGSLLLMQGETQTNWLHCLPKMKQITTPRINLTFRTFIP